MQLILTITVYILLCFIQQTNTKNVLLIQCVLTKSYSNVFEAIAHTLAEEHNVTFINRYELNITHPNITLIKMKEKNVEIREAFKNLYEYALKGYDTSQISIDGIMIDTKEYIDELFNDPAINYIFQNRNLYDLLITPTNLCEAYLRFAHYLNVPFVQVACSYPNPWQTANIGNPSFISTDPSLFLTPASENFWGRLSKFIQGMKLIYRYEYQYLPNLDKYSKQYFPFNTPKITDITRNTSLLLVNTQEQMVMVRPKLPQYIQIGGLHCRPAQDLPFNLQQFAENATFGLVYMSFGSSIDGNFPGFLLQSMLNVFRKMPHKFIIKLGQKVEDIPKNVLILKSSPQQDILGHPNTKLFIMHGGMLSLQEAVFHQVPALILPLALDQPSTAVLADKLGYGRYFPFSQFSEDAFYREISEMLSNPKYKKRVQELSALAKETFKDPKENLKWWINYVIRHGEDPLAKNKHEYNPMPYQIDVDLLIFFCCFALIVAALFVIILIKIVNRTKKIKNE